MKEELKKELEKSFLKVYGEKQTELLFQKLESVLKKYGNITQKPQWITQQDVMLITYADSLVDGERPGIAVLDEFLNEYVGDAISSVHLLPMFPFTSDDGFSVVDYKEIAGENGNWKHVNHLAESYQLMFDAVVNHISKSSHWFQAYLSGDERYKDYFIEAEKDADYSLVTRPRALPLLTEFHTAMGKKLLWTTFSDDQIDLNFRSIDIYIEILDILLFYAQNGARYIRLDAIGFLWKELGTTCMHLPQTHEIIQTFRKVLDEYAPGTLLITETNVPHKDNIQYLGGEKNEAHLVYQFPLPPLVMFSLLKEDCSKLAQWALSLETPKAGTTFFNFLSSHDGIGIRPVEGILTLEEQQFLVENTLKNGGEVSYKDNGDGTSSPYELNINYQDALASPEESDEVRIQKFLAAETILLSLQGLPGVYIHSLLGSRNDYYGKSTSKIPRRINRQKLEVNTLKKWISGKGNRNIIFGELLKRLQIRKEHPAFSPDSAQKVYEIEGKVLVIERKCREEVIHIFINCTSKKMKLNMQNHKGFDLLTGEKIEDSIELQEYQSMWLCEESI